MRRDVALDLGQLRLPHLALVVAGNGQQLADRLGVGDAGPMAAHTVDHRGEVLVAPRHLAQLGLVADDVGVGQARLQRDELIFHGLQSIKHRFARLDTESRISGRTSLATSPPLDLGLIRPGRRDEIAPDRVVG